MQGAYLAALTAVFLCWCSAFGAESAVYEGQWHTTNRKLDGVMTCAVSDLGNERWQGRFSGTWQGVPFDYTVAFTGKPSQLRGTAVIDGANYSWTGEFTDTTPSRFKGTFGGSRYTGYFDLAEKKEAISRPAAPQAVSGRER